MAIAQMSVNKHHLDKIFADFFRWHPTSLLIRGEPGTGKTTLALELLNYVKHIYRGYYISTRVSYTKLIEQFPWTRELLHDESVLTPFSSRSKEIPMVDVRLGTISSIIELVMRAVIKKRAFIILDSWDALAKEADMKERLKTEKTMVSLADANDSFLVFISEEPELSTVAYLVDGVATLGQHDNLRIIVLDKMRGMSIHDKRIFYTLEGSHFTPIIKPPNDSFHTLCKINGCKLFEPIQYDRRISTGNRYLDNAIGGIRKGNIILLETELNRDRRILGLILQNMILNNLRNNGSAIIVNTPDKPYASILKQIKPYCRKDDLDRLTILSTDEQLPDLPYLDSISYNDLEGSCNKLVCKRYPMLKKKGDTCILTMDLGMCETQLTDEQFELVKMNIIKLERVFRENGDVIVFVNTTGYKSMPLIQSTLDIHLKLYTKEGASFIETIKPHNGTYGVEVNLEEGYPSYILRRMV